MAFELYLIAEWDKELHSSSIPFPCENSINQKAIVLIPNIHTCHWIIEMISPSRKECYKKGFASL